MRYFEGFWTDNHAQHLELKHPQKYAEYQKMNLDKDKEGFFQEVHASFFNSPEPHLGKHGSSFFSMSKRIVQVVIGDMLLHLHDMDGISKARALSLFMLC